LLEREVFPGFRPVFQQILATLYGLTNRTTIRYAGRALKWLDSAAPTSGACPYHLASRSRGSHGDDPTPQSSLTGSELTHSYQERPRCFSTEEWSVLQKW